MLFKLVRTTLLTSHTPHLSQSFCVGAHVGEDDQHVFLALIGQILCCGQSQTRGDDAFNAMYKNENDVER